jgi:Tfp pilus assembly protein PilE
MGKLNKDNKGFGGVELLIVIVVVVALGLAGWFVYRHYNTSTSPATTKATVSTDKLSNIAFVQLNQDNNTVTQVTPSKLAKNTDQLRVLEALYSYCIGQTSGTYSGTYIDVSPTVFTTGNDYKQSGNFAMINANICEQKLTIPTPGGAAIYLSKTNTGTWQYDFETQIIPDCTTVNKYSFTKQLISQCMQVNTSTLITNTNP